jgi:hypothetical protein
MFSILMRLVYFEKKKDKTRITIGLCVNMDGSFKAYPVIINKSLKPRCFAKQNTSKKKIMQIKSLDDNRNICRLVEEVQLEYVYPW